MPVPLIPEMFTPKFMRSLINQLASADRTLHRAAEKTVKSMTIRSSADSQSTVRILTALLTGPHGDINFDHITKSKTIETLLSHVTESEADQVISLYQRMMLYPGSQDEKLAASRRALAADHLIFVVRNQHTNVSNADVASAGGVIISNILNLLAKFAYFDLDISADSALIRPDPPIAQTSRQVFRSRISSCLAHLSTKPSVCAHFAYTLAKTMRDGGSSPGNEKTLLEADESVSAILNKASRVLDEASTTTGAATPGTAEESYHRSIVLLYSFTILQIHNEDADAVGILEELNDIFDRRDDTNSPSGTSVALMEILLSFVAKPSQLFRRIIQQVFTSFTSNVDQSSLRSMVKVGTVNL